MPRSPRTLSYESAITVVLYGALAAAPFIMILAAMSALGLSNKMADNNGIVLAGVGKGAFALTAVALICEKLVGQMDGRILRMGAIAILIDLTLTLLFWIGAIGLPLPWLVRALMYFLGLLATPAVWWWLVRRQDDVTLDFGRPQEA